MKKLECYRDLYHEFLKSFYFGDFKYGDRFMTQAAACKLYQMPKISVEKVFRLLRQDGFIRTDGARGTTVTFDASLPEHMAKMPFYHPDPTVKDFETYYFPMIIIYTGLSIGLKNSDEVQRKAYWQETKRILQNLESGLDYSDKLNQLNYQIISLVDNQFVAGVLNHFLNYYICFNRYRDFPEAKKALIRENDKRYLLSFSELIQSGRFGELRTIVQLHYNVVFELDGVFVFSTLDNNSKLFKEQALYTKLLHDLLSKIVGSNMKAGDLLPTTEQLCGEYGVSEKTVRKAYGILSDMGFIVRNTRAGTRLTASFNDPRMLDWSAHIMTEQCSSFMDALDALIMINEDVTRELCSSVTPQTIAQMRRHLEEQHQAFLQYRFPFWSSDVLVTPIVSSLPSGITHRYYFYIYEIVTQYFAICLAQLMVQYEIGETVYGYLKAALDALAEQDYHLFLQNARCAVSLNLESIRDAGSQLVQKQGRSQGVSG